MASTTHTNGKAQTPAQTWNAGQYAANGRFVADLAGDVFRMLQAKPGERILDLGCGDGALTEQIAASGAMVTGCDADTSMLAAAATRGILTVAADMRALPFREEFDAVFSNAAIHWVVDQKAVAEGVLRALKPHGRFVVEMGGLGNIASIRTALQAVCATYGINAEEEAASRYPSREEMSAVLKSAGFTVETMNLLPRPTRLPSGMEEWLRTFRRGLFLLLPEADREEAIQRTVHLLRPALCDMQGVWWGDYVRLRFEAVKA